MKTYYKQHAYNVAAGPWHEGPEALPETSPWDPSAPPPVRLLAYYLPQFHAVEINDRAWGPGFTEWTNVTQAVARYAGHRQPSLPADLGFYDLSRKETIQRQAALARRAGIFGFCIHNYWFDGTKVLETPLRIILENADIELRFCLNWANENWTRRWDGMEQDIILEQKYQEGAAAGYVDSIADALRDPRYIRVDGRPLLMIYRPHALKDPVAIIDGMRARAREIGVGELFMVMPQGKDADPRPYGMDAAAGFPPHRGGWELPDESLSMRLFDPNCGIRIRSYDTMAALFAARRADGYLLLPGVCPSWDNVARMPEKGTSFHGATPAKYGAWLRAAGHVAMQAPRPDARIVFINAWNEWAESAYLEPDRHFGYAWLAETRRAFEDLGRQATDGPRSSSEGTFPPPDDRTPHRFAARPSAARRRLNRVWSFWRRLRKRLR